MTNSKETRVTREAAEFAFNLRYDDLPLEAVRIAKRCILDGLGLILAGSTQTCTNIVRRYCHSIGQTRESTLFGRNPEKVPAAPDIKRR